MSKAERTRQMIIEQTSTLFNTKGYANTTLSDITDATGLTKGSIYGNFDNRDEVALEVYLYNTNKLVQQLTVAIHAAQTVQDKLMAIPAFYRENYKQVFASGGCPMLNAAVEADDHLNFLKKSVQNSFKRFALKITKIIKDGKQEGVFRKQVDPAEYAKLFIVLLEGGVLLAKISNHPEHLMMALDRIEQIIKQEIEK